MLPYFAAAQIIIGLLSGRTGYGFYAAWCLVALAGFCLRALLYTLALSMSHKATFSILKEIRELILQKLPKMPLGTVMDTPSGEMKQVIVDQVESMERPLAHLLPEMTSNLLAPVCILLYLFFLDWRMALLHPRGHGPDDGGDEELRQAVRGVGKGHAGDERHHRRIYRRHRGHQGVQSGEKLLCKIRPARARQRRLLLQLDEELPAAHFLFQGNLPDDAHHHPARGLAPLPERQPVRGDVHHRHHPLPGYCRPAAGGNGLRGQPRQGGHHRGRGRRHPERRGTNPRHPAGFAAQPGHRCRARFLRLSRGRGGPPRRQPQHPLGQHGRLRRAQRRRKIDHRKTHRRLLGCKEGAHHPRRARPQGHPPRPALLQGGLRFAGQLPL